MENKERDSRAKLGCLVWYMDITEGTRAKLRCPVEYRDVTEGSRAKLGYLVGCMDVTGTPARPWTPP
jgi:hypothetical protein